MAILAITLNLLLPKTIQMNRELQLSFCETCKNRDFNMQKGIICSLSNEQADFEKSCPDYLLDEAAQLEYESKIADRKEMAVEDESFGLSASFGVKNGVIAGQIAIALAIIWFIGGIFLLDRIFFYPPVLLVLGAIAWYKGDKRKTEEKFKEWTKK